MGRPFSRIGAFLSRKFFGRKHTTARVFEKETRKLPILFNDEQITITVVKGDNNFRVTKIPSESLPALKDPIKAGQTRRTVVELKESSVGANIRHITYLANLTSGNLTIDDIGKRIRSGNYFIGKRQLLIPGKAEPEIQYFVIFTSN